MNITCSKEKLTEGLSLVGRTVSSRSTLTVLECILLTADETGLRLTANDLEMSIETQPLEAEILETGTVALNAKLLSEIVRKMPGEYIQIETDPNNETQCVSGRARFKISGLPGDEFPSLPKMEKTNGYTLKARQLKDMIRQTIFSVAVDDIKPVLTGELLQYQDNTFNIVAVDGFRISYRRTFLESDGDTMSVVVPAKALNELSRALPAEQDDDLTFYFTDKRIVFETSRFTFMSRLLDGQFIRYDQIFNEDFSTIVTSERVSLLTGLERACLLSRDNKKSPIKLEIRDDSVVITSNTEVGASYDEIMADIDGQEMEIAFNPRYLIEALRVIEEDRVILKFTTSLSPCIMKGVESDDHKYLILPLRLRT